MADAVTSQTILSGERKLIMKFTNVSDGTGESAVTKVDVSALSPAATQVRIEKIEFATSGMSVDILWDADTDVLAWHLPSDISDKFDFSEFGGVPNNSGTGKTGDIKFTTTGHSSGDRYVILLHMSKDR